MVADHQLEVHQSPTIKSTYQSDDYQVGKIYIENEDVTNLRSMFLLSDRGCEFEEYPHLIPFTLTA